MVFLVVLWVILFLASLTVLSSVITPFLKSLQTQNVISFDWAGYAVASNPLAPQPIVVGVSGSWTVPRVAASTGDTYSAAWIGIGGQTDETLIQCGTEHDFTKGQERYSAWYEMLPANAINIPSITVSPGDKFTASITLANNTNEWILEITNLSNGQGFKQNFIYNSSKLSAEWVVERPTVNNQVSELANFGSVTFTEAKAQLGTTVGTIRSFPNYEIVMENRENVPLASISGLSLDGSSFTVTYG
jgi:hypothetical protein